MEGGIRLATIITFVSNNLRLLLIDQKENYLTVMLLFVLGKKNILHEY